jgi:hypothetical protein
VIYKNNRGSFAKIQWWLWLTVTYSFDSGLGSIWTAHRAMDGGRWLRAAKRWDTGPAAALGGGSLPVKLGIELPVDKCYGTKTKTKLGG